MQLQDLESQLLNLDREESCGGRWPEASIQRDDLMSSIQEKFRTYGDLAEQQRRMFDYRCPSTLGLHNMRLFRQRLDKSPEEQDPEWLLQGKRRGDLATLSTIGPQTIFNIEEIEGKFLHEGKV